MSHALVEYRCSRCAPEGRSLTVPGLASFRSQIAWNNAIKFMIAMDHRRLSPTCDGIIKEEAA